MPPSVKMKTHKGIKKRFKVTATGKVTHKKCGSSHLNSHKRGKKIRQLRKKQVLQNGADSQRLRRALQQREVNRPGRIRADDVKAIPAEPTTTPAPAAAEAPAAPTA